MKHQHCLTHWGRVMDICISKLIIIGSESGLASSHYLNQCWNIVHWIRSNKLQCNINRNSYIFIKENEFENAIWKMMAILSKPQCVKGDTQFWFIIQIIYKCIEIPFCIYLNDISPLFWGNGSEPVSHQASIWANSYKGLWYYMAPQ